MFKIKTVAAIAALGTAVLFSSCQKETIKFYDLQITIDESGLAEGVPSPESYSVNFENTNTGDITTINSNGTKVTVSQLQGGVYNVTATAQFSVYNYIAAAKDVAINSENSLTSLTVTSSMSSSLVFKEIFYCGSKYTNPSTGAAVSYMKDNFFEIYNNGDEAIYLDGLAIGTTTNYSSATVNFANEAGNLVDLDGKDTGLKADEYITFNGNNQIAWQIPGDGDDYLLKPGESAVIASSATDHSKVGAGLIDLSSADFETVCDKYVEKGQVDNEQSVNLILVNPCNQNITNQYLPSVMTSGFVLFILDQKPENLPMVINTLAPASKFIAVKKSKVLDAVNWVKNATTDSHLPKDLDAGKIFVSGSYVGESISRKVKSTAEDGRKIYQDTNNTTDDFAVNTTPQIRRDGAKKPSFK